MSTRVPIPMYMWSLLDRATLGRTLPSLTHLFALWRPSTRGQVVIPPAGSSTLKV